MNGVVNREALGQQLQQMQRVFKITPRYQEMQVPLNKDIYSGFNIIQMTQEEFVGQVGKDLGSVSRAQEIYNQAEINASMAIGMLVRYGTANSDPYATRPAPYDVFGIPNWNSLFNSLDLCDCEHCRSVYSPAAYLVDILAYLKNRPANSAGHNPLQVLFQRRPDIGEIELSCQNTSTLVPYVDLVNEVLENAIAPFGPFTPFTIPATPVLETDLNDRKLSPALKTALNALQLSDYATIIEREKGKSWDILETAYTYKIQKEANTLQVTTRSLQTTGTPEELSANPQYLNAGAYDLLRKQVYPFTLPFDLWTEKARAYLDHLGVQRYQVMETFFIGDRRALLEDSAIANEYLQLTSVDRQIELTPKKWTFSKSRKPRRIDP
ncbi:Tc toxin subunit A [Leptolyngbya sp. 7M]|uniref:Tc toxin subunit A n=1 Tax=Leptolyngbya sp. 7M TaxID=2812896 RepID=UPI001B8B99B7|nr:Tc toxin subunit A [Leptolyngbya sp. 7M]QYO67819.1 hypothetical protein JVX88_14155 [Leptolyngbya sp. 7M]